MDFEAKIATLDNDGYLTVLSLADDAESPKRYVILQVTNQPTRQDVRLGQGGIHFELGGCKLSGYDLLKAIHVRGDQIVLTIDAQAAQAAGVDADVMINTRGKLVDGMTVREALEVFRDRLSPSS